MKSDNSFLKGTLILTVSSIVVKVIGALNWILLSRVLGGEGIGLYQMGFPIYLMAITVSSAGIPVAISIVTAEKVAKNDFKGAERVFHVTLRLLFVTGLVFSLALFFGAQKLIDWQFIRDARAYYSIIALAPAVFFVTFLASFRGYLQGWQIMTPTACSEITEQLVRVVTMLFFASYFLPKGLAAAAGGASMGAGAGAFCSKAEPAKYGCGSGNVFVHYFTSPEAGAAGFPYQPDVAHRGQPGSAYCAPAAGSGRL